MMCDMNRSKLASLVKYALLRRLWNVLICIAKLSSLVKSQREKLGNEDKDDSDEMMTMMIMMAMMINCGLVLGLDLRVMVTMRECM